MKTIVEFVKSNPVLSVVVGVAIILGVLIYPDVFKTLYKTGKDLGHNIFNGFF
jgi:hypothetical protein